MALEVLEVLLGCLAVALAAGFVLATLVVQEDVDE